MAGLLRRVQALLDKRRLVVLAMLLGWAVVIAAGAGAAPGEGRWLGVPALKDILLVVVAVIAAIGLLLFVAMVFSMQKGDAELPARRPMWPSLLILAALLIVALNLDRGDDEDRQAETPVVEDEEAEGGLRRTAVLGQDELVALLAVSALAIAAVIWSRRRLASLADDSDGGSPFDVVLAPAIGAASRVLELGTDPRSAVIGAYAALEGAFEEVGRDRQANETPSEYVAVVLDRFPVDAGPMLELARLYEVARFSDHAITEADRLSASDALNRVRAELAAVDPVDTGPSDIGQSEVGA